MKRCWNWGDKDSGLRGGSRREKAYPRRAEEDCREDKTLQGLERGDGRQLKKYISHTDSRGM